MRLSSITKRYGQVVACDDASLDLRAGEIHGVLGENGAGKSTLMKILIGLVQPDSGTIRVRGEVVEIADPHVASGLRIGMVHQHFSLVDGMSVWENVLLGDDARLNAKRARAHVKEIAEHYGLAIDPDAQVAHLSAGLRQRVELIKCLRRDPQIVILDEPTSVLTPAESEQLFATLRNSIVAEGRAVALVSHKLAEVLHATDLVTIMRQGRVVDRHPTAEATASSLAKAMVGRDVALRAEAAALGATDIVDEVSTSDDRHTDADQAAVLVLSDVRAIRDGVAVLDGLSLTVHSGEIVGVAGVEGNGQRELADVLSSLSPIESGRVVVAGRDVKAGRAGAMASAGVGVVPEDRHDSGCVLDMSVAENLVLDRVDRFTRLGFVDRRRMRRRAEQLMAEFEIQAASPDAPLRSLSGGNQQRVVLARELGHEPTVLVAAQPTRGLDVGAIEYMSQRIRGAAASGIGVLLISTELEEILDLSDRILVISRGRIIGEMTRGEATSERLGLLLGGVENGGADAA